MTAGEWVAVGVAGALSGGVYFWKRERVSEDWRRIKQAMSQIGGAGELTPPEFHDQRRFGGLMEDFLHVMRQQREEREQMEHEAADLRARLRQLEEVRTEFVANVSHELRTPLSIFQGYTETLIDNPDMPPEDARPILEIMHRHSRRLNALVEDLLILARLESRDEKLHLAPLDVAKFLRESVTDWSLRSAEKQIALTADIAPGVRMISADAFRLEQVMGNLIENAIKYTNNGGRVTVHASVAEDGVEIRVEDTGLGIPAADVPRIFERFYRADKGRSREHGGTGLGLSIVKHIVLAHGGSVRAESEHGRGTRIIFRLPKTPPPIPAAAPPGA